MKTKIQLCSGMPKNCKDQGLGNWQPIVAFKKICRIFFICLLFPDYIAFLQAYFLVTFTLINERPPSSSSGVSVLHGNLMTSFQDIYDMQNIPCEAKANLPRCVWFVKHTMWGKGILPRCIWRADHTMCGKGLVLRCIWYAEHTMWGKGILLRCIWYAEHTM